MTQRQTIALMAIGIIMGIFLLVVVFGTNGLLELENRHTTYAELLQANEALTQANVGLTRTIDRLQHDPEFLEAVARREFGMIRSDELIFQFQSKSQRSAP